MARKPNYNFEKRQKELARQAKKEEKRKRKQGGDDDDEKGSSDAENQPS